MEIPCRSLSLFINLAHKIKGIEIQAVNTVVSSMYLYEDKDMTVIKTHMSATGRGRLQDRIFLKKTRVGGDGIGC